MKVATLCYLQDHGKTLMIHYNKRQKMAYGKWNGLGGKMNLGESPEECLVREVKEESGLTIKKPKLKGIITFPGNDIDNGEDWYVFVYIANEFSGELIETDEGSLMWVDNEKIKDLNLHQADKVFLEWLKKDKIFTAKFNYENENLKDYVVSFY